ncbi:MAG TPA: hypothetical protein DD727_06345 [Clostridiales bacterium]|nr:hypothetical protein [Clostridiales bacterium]
MPQYQNQNGQKSRTLVENLVNSLLLPTDSLEMTEEMEMIETDPATSLQTGGSSGNTTAGSRPARKLPAESRSAGKLPSGSKPPDSKPSRSPDSNVDLNYVRIRKKEPLSREDLHSALKPTSANLVQGILWSEILGAPRCRRRNPFQRLRNDSTK